MSRMRKSSAIARDLACLLNLPLDRSEWEVVHESGRVRRNERGYFIPVVYVAPMEYIRRTLTRPGMLEAYREPLLVCEVWSPSTGDYDVTDKFDEYKGRGDREIWLIHPYDRTVAVWRRQPDGSYPETPVREGTLVPAFLPGVSISFTDLFGV